MHTHDGTHSMHTYIHTCTRTVEEGQWRAGKQTQKTRQKRQKGVGVHTSSQEVSPAPSCRSSNSLLASRQYLPQGWQSPLCVVILRVAGSVHGGRLAVLQALDWTAENLLQLRKGLRP